MSETKTDSVKKVRPGGRSRLGSLGSIRREIGRIYDEARTAGADPLKIQYYRALTFILSAAASVRKDEAIEDIEARIKALEEKKS